MVKKSTSSSEWMYYQSSSTPHNCEVRTEVDDLEVVIPGNGRISKFRRAIRGFFLASHKNRRAIRLHRSHANIRFERSRQLRLHPCMIHPFSNFRVFWEVLMLVLTATSVLIMTYYQAYPFNDEDVTVVVNALLVFSSFYYCDIALNFITGTVCGKTRRVNLAFKSVAWPYIKGPLILDVIAVLPVEIVYYNMMSSNLEPQEKDIYAVILHILSFAKAGARLLRAIRYYRNTSKVLGLAHEPEVYTFYVFLVIYYVHYSSCLVFYVSSFFDNFDSGQSHTSWFRLTGAGEEPPIYKYSRSLIRIISASMGLCIRYIPLNIEDQLSTTILCWIGQIFFLVVVGKNLQMARAKHASSTRYDAMMTQVKQFMDSRKLPRRLQLHVVEFYRFRYQKAFFNEPKVMHSISSQLKQDFMFQRSKDLVSDVAFFTELPVSVLVRIVSVMRIEFFLGNEEVIRLHSAGNQMYFIKSGTVAVYSSAGKEVCHLEDGNHFGEIALVLSNIKRVASVVTLEKCELFVLQRDDFYRAMASYPEYLDKIRKTALKRLERTLRMENASDEEVQAYLSAMAPTGNT